MFEPVSAREDLIKNIQVTVKRNKESLQGQVLNKMVGFPSDVSEYSQVIKAGMPINLHLTLCDNKMEVVANLKSGKQKKISFTVRYTRTLPRQEPQTEEKSKYPVKGSGHGQEYSVQISNWQISMNDEYFRYYTIKNESDSDIWIMARFAPTTNYDEINGSESIPRFACPEGKPCTASAASRKFHLDAGSELKFRQYLRGCQTASEYSTGIEGSANDKNFSKGENSTVVQEGTIASQGFLSPPEIDRLLDEYEQLAEPYNNQVQQLMQGQMPDENSSNVINEKVLKILERINKNIGSFSEKQALRMQEIALKYIKSIKLPE